MSDDIDLCELMRYTEDEIAAKEYTLYIVFTVYILSKLAASQSMGLIGGRIQEPEGCIYHDVQAVPGLPDADPPLARLPPDPSLRPFPRHLGCVLLQHGHHDQGPCIAPVREAL